MIRLPNLFQKKLEENPTLLAEVRRSLDLFEPWLEQSGMPFFPGFTDHSPRHINEVLDTASSLISDASHNRLSAEDIAVLVLAILLHDCGMHLTQDGFRSLVANNSAPLISGLGDRPWKQLWLDFLSEAQRFGQERLIAVFGDAEPLRLDLLDLENLSERDCLLAGEFVRRHHARLAHEIAISGVPTKASGKLELVGLDPELKDLAGLVARSHGMSMRSTFPYLQERYSIVAEHRKIKTPFLMAVLRIADYVQVQSERALKTLLSIKELRSPLSRQEWRNHFSVRDVTMRHEDPEAMFVRATPPDVKTFLRLEALFKDIQKELDQSWATIGEVYGRLGDLAALGLTVRRLRSNLDDKDSFAKTVSYVPIKSGFQTSGPDLLKLLVGPLYEYRYDIGIRELLQNAVDAFKEAVDLRQHLGHDLQGVTVDIQQAEDGTGWIVVTDDGVGMTLQTIVNYFLVAGASFRDSDVWKSQHIDSTGKSRVMRGGRFGVGALAAFLLGDEIKVRTRHMDRDETEGIEFSARMDDPIVELRKCVAPAGTSISIFISDSKVLNFLSPLTSTEPNTINQKDKTIDIRKWERVDWFAQAFPPVIYRWSGFHKLFDPTTGSQTSEKLRGEFKPTRGLIPVDGVDDGWVALSEPHPYKSLLWKYPEPAKRRHKDYEYLASEKCGIVVNGIRVQSVASTEMLEIGSSYLREGPHFAIARPSLAIFDPSGVCPINLQRSAVSFSKMQIDTQLAKSILATHLQRILLCAPDVVTCKSYLTLANSILALPGLRFGNPILPPICATSNGFFLATPRFFSELKIQTVMFMGAEDLPEAPLDQFLSEHEALFIRSDFLNGEQSTLGWFRSLYGGHLNGQYGADFPPLSTNGACGYLRANTWKMANVAGRVSRAILRRIKVVDTNEDLVLLSTSEKKSFDSSIQRLKDLHSFFPKTKELALWKIEASAPAYGKNTSLLCEEWLRQVHAPLLKIPHKPAPGLAQSQPAGQ